MRARAGRQLVLEGDCNSPAYAHAEFDPLGPHTYTRPVNYSAYLRIVMAAVYSSPDPARKLILHPDDFTRYLPPIYYMVRRDDIVGSILGRDVVLDRTIPRGTAQLSAGLRVHAVAHHPQKRFDST